LALKAKHEVEKNEFEKKIKDLRIKLAAKDETDFEKTKTKGMATA